MKGQKLICGLLLFALCIPVLASCGKQTLSAPPLRNSITVEYDTATAAPGDVVRAAAFDCYVHATVEELSFEKDYGTFGELCVSVGDRVEQGDLLATLDRTTYDAALESARTALDERNAKLNTDRRKAEIAIELAKLDLADARDAGG